MIRRLSRKRVLAGVGATLNVPLACRATAADTYTMRMQIALDATSAQGVAASRFAAAVLRRSKGQLQVEIYPNGQLAKEQAILDGLTTGVLDLAIQGVAILVPLLPQFQIFQMPFLFKDLEAGYRVVDGAIGEELFAQLEPKGIEGLGCANGGFRELETTSKAIVVPDDMKGLRIRIQSGAVYVAIFQALGAIPVTIDVSEVFVALSQRTIDGIDATTNSFIDFKLYTIAKQVAMFNHVSSMTMLMGSKRKIDALPLALQKIIKEEGKASIPPWRSLQAHETLASIQMLRRNGVSFTEIQHSAFRKAMDPVYAMFQSKIGGNLIERAGRVAGGT
jgi:TRAP-type transport system periplasmic protein